MADDKAAPPTSASVAETPTTSSTDTGNSNHNSNNSGKSRGPYRRPRGPKNNDNNDHDHESGSVGRRKKPELEHYKPGAFSSRKSDDQDHQSNENSEHSKPNKGSKKHHQKPHPNNEQVEQISDKVTGMSIDGSEKGSSGRNKNRKKPDQAHYVPKKSAGDKTAETSDCKEPTPTNNEDKCSNKPQEGSSGGRNGGNKKSKGGKGSNSNGGKNQRQQQRDEPTKKDVKNIDEAHRNGHVEPPASSSDRDRGQSGKSNNNRRSNNASNTGNQRNNTENQDQHENNLPPRLRQNQENNGGGRSDRGRNNKSHGGGKKPAPSGHRNSPANEEQQPPRKPGGRRFDQQLERESTSPMVSNEARSPSPHQQRRDSASSNRHNRRSYSPQHRGSVTSPTYNNRRGGNNHRRGTDRGSGNNTRRYDYHRESSDWRYDTNNAGNKPLQNKNNMPPRFQKSNSSKDSKDHFEHWTSSHQHHGPPRRTQHNMRDYEVDDNRVYDYEKDDDEDLDPPAVVDPKINDWCIQDDDEEEDFKPKQQEQPTHRGGILRLPPDAMTTTSSSNSNSSQNPDWRAHHAPPGQSHGHHHHQGHHGHGQQHHQYSQREHYQSDSNPAWRGMDHRNSSSNSSSNERYLFDPRNPNKPIPAHQRGTRFPMDPRFAQPSHISNNGPPPGPRMSGYRPPFPPSTSAGGGGGGPSSLNMTMMSSDPKSLAAEGGEAAKILGASELRLMAIVRAGGPEKLCELWHQDVAEVRQTIMRTFRHLLQNDLVFCARTDVEFFVWKICFYNLVATLKTWLQGGTIPQAERHAVEENVMELLNEGLNFYTEMLELLDRTYHIGLEQYYDVLEARSSDPKIRCALVSAQKCLLCLGDLARYKEMIQSTSNYGKARQYYQKASHIDTRNAKPFNQLAILAWTAKRKFEAVYYHMRCLQTKTPVESSRQSLTEIFEEIRRRWDLSEKKRLEERAQRKKEADSERDRMHLIKGTRLRKEIWIKPDGEGRRLHRTTSAQKGAPDSEEAEMKEMSTTELNRRFNNAFLHLIGTLFTHINIDAFPEACDLLQKEFRILLSRSPLPIDCKRLVQIMALNMFIIEQTKMKSGDNKYVSVTQNYALQLAFEMFGILVERCNELMLSFIPPAADFSSPSIFHDDDLPNLLSAVKVWCDWLMGNNDTWYPVLCDEPFNELAKLATHLEKLKPLISPILEQCLNEERYLKLQHREDYSLIKLEEDAVLCGFTPWTLGVNWSIYRRYAPRHVPSTLLQDARRLDAINFCIDFLEGLEPPVLKWSPPDSAHISLVENVGSTADKVNAKLTHMLSREQDILEESYSDDDGSGSSSKDKSSSKEMDIDRSSKIGQLKIRKEELERRRKEEEETRKLQQQILSEHVSVTLEVCPKFVVPDTNCFVDYLPEISRLAINSPFQLRVPIVVLKELDGLAKGARPAKYASPEHAAMVSENARRALSFLKDRPPNTRCVTSRGTVLSSLGVTNEEDIEGDKNNDDLILDACLNLSMHKEEIRGDMRVVYRDLVLLTDDRNLKLKAHVTDIPVNKLSDFIHWAYST